MLNFTVQDILEYLYRIPCVLIALILHEVAHGWVASKLGDPTARNLGRLTLNPLKHLDPIGTVCMILFRFGWAKPVPVNMRYFKKPRRDMAIVALAGPVTNILLAVIGALGYVTLCELFISGNQMNLDYYMGVENLPPATVGVKLLIVSIEILKTFILLNVSLALFNLIPINPLDGSRILHILLPPKAYYWLMQREKNIMVILMVVLLADRAIYSMFNVSITMPLSYAAIFVSSGIIKLIYLLPFFG